MRAISACTRRSTRRTSSAEGSLCAASTSSWPRITVSGVRSSCEASATKARCPAKASVEPVEHVVEGVGEHLDLLALAARVVDPRVQVARIDARRDGGHPAQRAREARAEQVGGEQRARERQQAGEDERARDAALGMCDGRERLADADRHGQGARHVHDPLEQAQVADVGERDACE